MKIKLKNIFKLTMHLGTEKNQNNQAAGNSVNARC